jgi:hypothetical protein
MLTNDGSAPKFTPARLFRILASQVVVLVLIEGYWRWRAGKWEAKSLVAIPVFAWTYQLMQQQADGTFSLERYRAALFWDRKQWRFVVIVGVAIAAICTVCIVVFHL